MGDWVMGCCVMRRPEMNHGATKRRPINRAGTRLKSPIYRAQPGRQVVRSVACDIYRLTMVAFGTLSWRNFMDNIEKRRRQAATRILENEQLTAGLDDTTANILLQWGLALAEDIVMRSQELDDEQAEEAMYAPMKAVRKLMRAVNKWLSSGDDTYLDVVLKQARIIYGKTAVSSIESLAHIHTIPALRQAIENPYPPIIRKDHDKEAYNIE
jgi:hypothetical protein